MPGPVHVASRLLAGLGVALALTVSSPADAAFSVIARPWATARVTEARVALARGPSRSTLWAQARLEGAADAVLWVVPLPAGAAADVSQAGLLDALEEATAPRVRPPADAPPSGLSCSVPTALEVVTSGDAEQGVFPSATAIADSTEAALAQAVAWGFDTGALDEKQLALALATDGARAAGRFLLLRMEPPDGASATITLRVHGPSIAALPMSLLQADASPLPFTVWLLGDGRGAAEGLKELALQPGDLRWSPSGKSNYSDALAQALAGAAGKGVVIEAAGSAPLRSTTVVPGVGSAPSAVDAYLVRAATRADEPFSLGPASEQIHKTLVPSAVFAEACPRGDLAAPVGWACSEAGPGDAASSELLAPGQGADDLRFVFGGSVAARWVTRLAGQIPAQSAGRSFAPLFGGAGGVSIVKQPAAPWADLCSGSSSGAMGGVMGGATGGAPGGGFGAGVGQGQGGARSTDDPGYDSGASQVDVRTSTSFSCSGSGNDSCSGSSDGAEHDGCGKSTDEGDEGASDGCSCSDSSEGSDGCDSSSSDGSDGCDSSSSSGGDSCGSSSGGGESCSGSSGGGESCSGGSNNCSVSKRGAGRGRSKLSRVALLAAALALPLRRWRRRKRSAS
jgi:hypothetical protein